MRKNNRGFTLIELLAVIVILALLMMIAIPSVTRYITQSRVKTVTKTMDSYITAVVQEVNDGDYHFSDSTKIYAIPIECVSLEKGGTNPFGEWMQANDSYWAYVLVQYDSENYNYKYGFTFKDSAGYGMYPTVSANIDEKSNQVKTGYDDLTKPESGKAVEFVSSEKWNGFTIKNDTELIVLESTSDGEKGNGETTCTLCQKGNNYEQIEEEKSKRAILRPYSNSVAFWNSSYRSKIKTITFERGINVADGSISWDIGVGGKGDVIAYVVTNSTDSSYYDLYIQSDYQLNANENMSYWFSNFYNLDKINNLDLLSTADTTDMSYMFYYTGSKSKVFTLDLGKNFDTSKVTNMKAMFCYAGGSDAGLGAQFTLNLGDKFDTSNVTDMSSMFSWTGYTSSNFSIDLGNKFDTSNVTSMSLMFKYAGYHNKNFTLNLGDKFDTSSVTRMDQMFMGAGTQSDVYTLDLGNKFDTSQVTRMDYMFYWAGCNSDVFTLNLGNRFDMTNVVNTNNMFYGVSQYGKANFSFSIDITGNKVTNYNGMFDKAKGKIIVNYLNGTSDLVDNMISTGGSNVIKGTQLD